MQAARWLVGSLLVSFLVAVGLIPPYLPAPRPARASQQQEHSEPRRKRVYTNDDWPFNRPRADSPSPAPSTTSTASPTPEKLAPFVPTPMEIVEKMLELAHVTPDDVVYDMGSGDGRIVIRAAQRYGARSVGVEIDPALVKESTQRVKELGLENRVKIIEGDLLQTDLTPATVVTVYLLPGANEKLRPILEKELRPGSRVVAHDMRIPGWEAFKEEPVRIGNATHFVYLYTIPGAFRR